VADDALERCVKQGLRRGARGHRDRCVTIHASGETRTVVDVAAENISPEACEGGGIGAVDRDTKDSSSSPHPSFCMTWSYFAADIPSGLK
jgi:hypothetical protein